MPVKASILPVQLTNPFLDQLVFLAINPAKKGHSRAFQGVFYKGASGLVRATKETNGMGFRGGQNFEMPVKASILPVQLTNPFLDQLVFLAINPCHRAIQGPFQGVFYRGLQGWLWFCLFCGHVYFSGCCLTGADIYTAANIYTPNGVYIFATSCDRFNGLCNDRSAGRFLDLWRPGRNYIYPCRDIYNCGLSIFLAMPQPPLHGFL